MPKKNCLTVRAQNVELTPGDACKLIEKWKGQPSNLCHDERVKAAREDFSQAAVRIVREATEE